MSKHVRGWLAVCATLIAAVAPGAASAASITTQTSSLPLTTTDFTSGANKVTPLSFQQFDTMNGTRSLDSVTLTFHAAIQNQFTMSFVNPATITDSVATNNTSAPGPTITVYQPDGTHPLLTVSAPNDPTSLTRSITYTGTTPATFGSSLPTTSPNFVAPTMTQASQTVTLTDTTDLGLFSGNKTVQLPVAAKAFSSFSSSSGNGFGSVMTQGTADVTVTYAWHDNAPAQQTVPNPVPEPVTMVLWGVGGAMMFAVHRRRRSA
jgi:hypothetical protein